ncbi:MAG: hypothetical protein AABY54_09950 [Deltaproteobacteria bacterium]
MKEVTIAIAGLGRVGSLFLKKMTEQKGKGTRIVGLVEIRPDAPGVMIAEKENIKIYPTVQDLVRIGDSVDVIFDLTGSMEVRKALRSGMAESNNRHTVIAPEIMAFLIWDLIASGEAFPENHASLQGY